MVPSPCINLCRLDPSRTTCLGCRRTLDEIARWGSMSDAERLTVWARLKAESQQR